MTVKRKVIRLKTGWAFTRPGDNNAAALTCDDSAWERVDVPHDWAIAGPFDKENDIDRRVPEGQLDVESGVTEITGRTGGLPHAGEGWYRKQIDIPEASAGSCFRLECDGIMSHSTV